MGWRAWAIGLCQLGVGVGVAVLATLVGLQVASENISVGVYVLAAGSTVGALVVWQLLDSPTKRKQRAAERALEVQMEKCEPHAEDGGAWYLIRVAVTNNDPDATALRAEVPAISVPTPDSHWRVPWQQTDKYYASVARGSTYHLKLFRMQFIAQDRSAFALLPYKSGDKLHNAIRCEDGRVTFTVKVIGAGIHKERDFVLTTIEGEPWMGATDEPAPPTAEWV